MTKGRQITTVKHCIFFCASLEQGGTERVIALLSSAMAAHGRKIEIVTYYDREIFFRIDSRVKVTSAERESGSCSFLQNLFWLRLYFRKNADLVCSFMSSFNMLALVACVGLGIPVVVSERTDPMYKNSIYRFARDFLYRFANALVVQTQKSFEYFASKSIGRNCVLICNPLSPDVAVGSALSKKKAQIIVSVGRLDPLKNQELLIRAFRKVSRDFPEYKLVIYGEGSFRTHLEQVRGALGLEGKVLFPGERSDVYDAISSARLFVLSSDFEGMPNALLEAMCLGLPTISTKVSGAMEVIVHGYNGILIDKGDETGLVEAIERLLGDEGLSQTLAQNATKLANQLNMSSITFTWISLLENVMNGKFNN